MKKRHTWWPGGASVGSSELGMVISRAGKFLYRYKECLDPGPESNNLMDHFLYFLNFDPVLLNILSIKFYQHFMKYLCVDNGN